MSEMTAIRMAYPDPSVPPVPTETCANPRPPGRPYTTLDTPLAVRHPLTSFSLKIMKPTFRPHRKKRARKIGYRARMATKGGRKVIKARRAKGRKRLTVV